MIDVEYRAGALVAEPVLRFTPGRGTACLSLRLGQSSSRLNEETGQWERAKEHYFDAVIWPTRRDPELPSVANAALRRGMQVVLRGRFETRKWVNKRGDDVYSTEFVADRVFVDVEDAAPAAKAPEDDDDPDWLRGGGQ